MLYTSQKTTEVLSVYNRLLKFAQLFRDSNIQHCLLNIISSYFLLPDYPKFLNMENFARTEAISENRAKLMAGKLFYKSNNMLGTEYIS